MQEEFRTVDQFDKTTVDMIVTNASQLNGVMIEFDSYDKKGNNFRQQRANLTMYQNSIYIGDHIYDPTLYYLFINVVNTAENKVFRHVARRSLIPSELISTPDERFSVGNGPMSTDQKVQMVLKNQAASNVQDGEMMSNLQCVMERNTEIRSLIGVMKGSVDGVWSMVSNNNWDALTRGQSDLQHELSSKFLVLDERHQQITKHISGSLENMSSTLLRRHDQLTSTVQEAVNNSRRLDFSRESSPNPLSQDVLSKISEINHRQSTESHGILQAVNDINRALGNLQTHEVMTEVRNIREDLRSSILGGIHDLARRPIVDNQPIVSSLQEVLRKLSTPSELQAVLLAVQDAVRRPELQTSLQEIARKIPEIGVVLRIVQELSQRPAVDLQPIQKQLQDLSLKSDSQAITMQGLSQRPAVDLQPIQKQLQDLSLKSDSQFSAIHVLSQRSAVDLQPIQKQLQDLSLKLSSQPDSQAVLSALQSQRLTVDLQPVHSQLQEILLKLSAQSDLQTVLNAIQSFSVRPANDLSTILSAVKEATRQPSPPELATILKVVQELNRRPATLDVQPIVNAVETALKESPIVVIKSLVEPLQGIVSELALQRTILENITSTGNTQGVPNSVRPTEVSIASTSLSSSKYGVGEQARLCSEEPDNTIITGLGHEDLKTLPYETHSPWGQAYYKGSPAAAALPNYGWPKEYLVYFDALVQKVFHEHDTRNRVSPQIWYNSIKARGKDATTLVAVAPKYAILFEFVALSPTENNDQLALLLELALVLKGVISGDEWDLLVFCRTNAPTATRSNLEYFFKPTGARVKQWAFTGKKPGNFPKDGKPLN